MTSSQRVKRRKVVAGQVVDRKVGGEGMRRKGICSREGGGGRLGLMDSQDLARRERVKMSS